MTDPTYSLEIAIRADEKAKAAHERLDRMNGSIDRLAGFVAETNAKIDSLVATQAHSDGLDEGEASARKGFLDSRRFVVTTFVVMFGGLVAAAATLVWHALHG